MRSTSAGSPPVAPRARDSSRPSSPSEHAGTRSAARADIPCRRAACSGRRLQDPPRPRLGQPINTVTSTAYLVAAAWVWGRHARRRAIWSPALAWIGVGSIAYHGPGTRPGKLVHDSALIASSPSRSAGVSSPPSRIGAPRESPPSGPRQSLFMPPRVPVVAVVDQTACGRATACGTSCPPPPSRCGPTANDHLHQELRPVRDQRPRVVIRSAIDRVFGLIALALARGFHRTVAVENLDAARAEGPRVIVVNHFNGFMDVIVMVAALRRLPRFVGKATLNKVMLARPFLRLAGVVLVQRTVDGEGTGQNINAFAQCYERLEQGDCIVIFPEGTTHDRESLAPIRTGAARIALGAVTADVSLVRVVPVGLTYGDKTRLRNAVLVTGGPTIPVGSEGEEDHEAVRALTDEITEGLDAVIPGVDDPLEAWALDRAATIAARTQGHEPRLAERQAAARQVARSPSRPAKR